MDKLDKIIDLAVESVKMASIHIRSCLNSNKIDIISSIGKDIKLKNDIESENIIIGNISKYSSYPIISEEKKSISYKMIRTEKYYWVIDPIDGTYNYSRTIPLSCISVALWSGSSPIVGVVYDFNSEKLYQGLSNKCLLVNGKEMVVSENENINNSVICSGLPTMRSFSNASLMQFADILQQFKKVRFIGSAALSLAWVASGLVDVYAEENIYFWDVAAGLALVKASGGDYYFETNNSNSNLMNVIATNGHLNMDEMKKMLIMGN